MANVYIRDLDEQVYANLKAISKRSKVSVNHLIKSILKEKVVSVEAKNIDEKYQDNIENMINIYIAHSDEIRSRLDDIYLILEKRDK